MKRRDGLAVLMSWLFLDMFLVVAMNTNQPFLWITWVISAVVWVVYTWTVMTEKQPLIWLEVDGEWRAIDSAGHLVPRSKMPPRPVEQSRPRTNYQEEDRL